jgi:hypothetical protein
MSVSPFNCSLPCSLFYARDLAPYLSAVLLYISRDMAFLVVFLISPLLQGYPSLVAAESIQALLEVNADNLTAFNTVTAPSWVSAPDYRGMSNILYSCLLTLVACIYTAIHLNVPKPY